MLIGTANVLDKKIKRRLRGMMAKSLIKKTQLWKLVEGVFESQPNTDILSR